MKRVAPVLFAVLACGPRGGVDSEAGSDTGGDATTIGDPGTTSSPTSGGTNTTQPTTATTDPTTSDPSTTGLVDSGEDTMHVGFINRPDGYAPGLECDAWAQDCPEGTKCVPAATGGTDWFSGTTCAPLVDAPAAIGEPCTHQEGPWSGQDDCDLGSVCWFFDDSLEGTCVAQCTGSRIAWTCPDANVCHSGSQGVVLLCLPACDPLAPACGRGRHCMFGERAGDGGFGQFFCQPGAPLYEIGGYGAECDPYGNSCDEGLACVPPAHVPGCVGAGCCTELGMLANPPSCPDATQTCIPAYPDGDAPEGLDDLCYCGVEP